VQLLLFFAIGRAVWQADPCCARIAYIVRTITSRLYWVLENIFDCLLNKVKMQPLHMYYEFVVCTTFCNTLYNNYTTRRCNWSLGDAGLLFWPQKPVDWSIRSVRLFVCLYYSRTLLMNDMPFSRKTRVAANGILLNTSPVFYEKERLGN